MTFGKFQGVEMIVADGADSMKDIREIIVSGVTLYLTGLASDVVFHCWLSQLSVTLTFEYMIFFLTYSKSTLFSF